MIKGRDKAKQQKELFLKQLEKNPVVISICQKMKIPRSNIYRWLESDPEFKKKYNKSLKKSTDNINDLAVSVIIQALKNNSIGAAKYWLSSRHPDFIRDKFRYEKANPIEPFQMMITTIDNKGHPINRKGLANRIKKNKNGIIKLRKVETSS